LGLRSIDSPIIKSSDLDVPAASFDDAERHRQTKASASFAFGREERL
jgi:hypothetical protein